ncbi:MAG TPA: DNA-formamidopyrimidine glycosylase family protein [Polyangiaceae bacterium]|nr:DNA-formamidopyrimidine glycosylase family protein [Polyangiaceae bacterium]
MPEGDSIHLLANKLTRAVVCKDVVAFSARTISDDVARSLVGVKIQSATARGKNLLIGFGDGRVLHVHLRMLGRVRVVAKAPRVPSQLSIQVDGVFVVGWKIPVLRLMSKDAAARVPELASLGPDLLAPDFEEQEAVARLRRLPDREIGDALLVQSALAGIGNVYKSEVLFIERVSPFARVADLDHVTLAALVRRARKLLQLNVAHGGPRVTRGRLGARHYVYGRAGRPCFRCRKAIAVARQGAPPGRTTYFCAECQGVDG